MIKNENKSKIFLVIIAILVVANIALLAFFLTKKENPPQSNSRQDRKAFIAAFLKNEIGFDTLQLKQFDTLSTAHKEKMSGTFDKMKSGKGAQFNKLAAANFTDSAINALVDQSASTQRSIEIMMFTHLRNIRMLCKPDQLQKFDSLFGKVLNRRSESRRKSANK